jgi:CyaY protein
MLSEDDYLARAGRELRLLVNALDGELADELDAELESDILTIEFPDGSRYVVNSHRAARQIWMAAERTAWHFDWSPEHSSWIATKTGDELWSALGRALSQKLGRAATLARPTGQALAD